MFDLTLILKKHTDVMSIARSFTDTFSELEKVDLCIHEEGRLKRRTHLTYYQMQELNRAQFEWLLLNLDKIVERVYVEANRVGNLDLSWIETSYCLKRLAFTMHITGGQRELPKKEQAHETSTFAEIEETEYEEMRVNYQHDNEATF